MIINNCLRCLFKPIRRHIFLIFLCSFFLFARGQNLKEKKFINTVDSVIIYYTNKDSANFSRFIDTGMGIYILRKSESGDRFSWYQTLGFSQSFFDENSVYDPIRVKTMYDSLKVYKLIYASLPEYEMSPVDKWNKEGLFVDTTKIDHTLSDAAKHTLRYDLYDADVSEKKEYIKQINAFKEMENNSRRIVLATNNYRIADSMYIRMDFIFYLMYKNHRWYITIIDYATSDG